MPAIRNARLVLKDRIEPGAVEFEGSRITAVRPGARGGAGFDANGAFLVPGFVDLHVHGGGGADFLDAQPEAFETALKFFASRGTTSLLATALTASPAEMCAFLSETARAMARSDLPSEVLGAHLEGPFLNPQQKGCHLVQYIRNPTESEVDGYLRFVPTLRHVTIAPEIDGAPEAIRRFRAAGVTVSAGHTMADERHLRKALEAGLSHGTHLWSSMSSFHREGPFRILGAVEWLLGEDAVTTEVIADLKHLSPSFLRIAYRTKGPDRLCLVSDAMRGAGMPPGSRWRIGPEETGVEAIVEDGVGMLPDRSSLASSVTPIDRMVKNVVEAVGVPLHEAIRMASLTPARVAGVADRKGSLEAGKDADFVLLGEGLGVLGVWGRGRAVSGVALTLSGGRA
ncbi:MAG: N-acetylglucosamine-6-phosphate deacetylase [Planctomycetota bacterium]